jgi:hypothetical protein
MASSDKLAVFKPEARPISITGLRPILAVTAGSAAFGALAVGAVAVGALAIGRLKVGVARIEKLEIDELSVRRLRVQEVEGAALTPPSTPPAG